MTAFLLVKILHVIGACVLLGIGAGIAFFMLMAHRSGDPRIIAHTAGIVVLADTVFTATAVAAQPVTGLLLVEMGGHSLLDGWVLASLVLYGVTGLFWLPVVWMQLRMRQLARRAVAEGAPLPPAYHRLFRLWFAFGFPAFAAVLGIIALMVLRPAF